MFERKTKVSIAIVELLKSEKSARSINQILDGLAQKGLNPNKSTIYRVLEKLIDKKRVKLLQLKNGRSYYEWSDCKSQLHFFCHRCETVFCLTQCKLNESLINLALENKRFKVSDHDYNLYGECETCVDGPEVGTEITC